MCKVTVLMITHNNEKGIGNCVQKILGQTLQSLQLLIVDDCSTDDTVTVLRKYESLHPERVTVLCNETNLYSRGEYVARQAVEHIRGEYICILDQDDSMDRDALREMYETAQDTGADVVSMDYKASYSDGSMSGESFQRIPKIFCGEITLEKRIGLMLCDTLIWGTLLKRELYCDVVHALKRSLDIEFSTRVYLGCHHVEKCRDSLYYFTQNANSMTRSQKKCILTNDRLEKSALSVYEIAQTTPKGGLHNALMARFARFYYTNNLMRYLNLSETYDIRYLMRLREGMQQLYPDWMENIYLRDRIAENEYQIAVMNYDNPGKFLKQLNIGLTQSSSIYIQKENRDYREIYLKHEKKIKKLLTVLKQKGKRIAVWGAGQRGAAFAEVFAADIDYIFDTNINRQGETVAGFIIQSAADSLEEADVVIVTNSGWYKDIEKVVEPAHIQMIDMELPV